MSIGYVGVTEGTDKKIGTLQKTEDGNAVHIERVAIDRDLASLGSAILTEVTSAGTESSAVDCKGKGTIVVKVTYNANDVEADFSICFLDASDNVIGYTDAVTIQNRGIQDGSRYLGQMFVVENSVGASKFRVRMDSAPTNSGNATVYAFAV